MKSEVMQERPRRADVTFPNNKCFFCKFQFRSIVKFITRNCGIKITMGRASESIFLIYLIRVR